MATKKERLLKKQASRVKHDVKMASKGKDVQLNAQHMIKALNLGMDKIKDEMKSLENTVYNEIVYKSIIYQYENVVNDLQLVDKRYNVIDDLNIDLTIPNKVTTQYNYVESVTIPTVNLDRVDYKEEVNYQAIIDYWQEEYGVDLTQHMDWSTDQLTILDSEIKALESDFGMGTDNQFETNYAKAGEVIGEETNAKDDLNGIVQREMDSAPNNAATTYRLIEYEFNTQVTERFEASDQVQQQKALDYVGVTADTMTPAERRAMRDL